MTQGELKLGSNCENYNGGRDRSGRLSGFVVPGIKVSGVTTTRAWDRSRQSEIAKWDSDLIAKLIRQDCDTL